MIDASQLFDVTGGTLVMTGPGLTLSGGEVQGAIGANGKNGVDGTVAVAGTPGTGTSPGGPGGPGGSGTAGKAGKAGKLAEGGAIDVTSGTLDLTSVVLTGNTAVGGSGGQGGTGGVGVTGGTGGSGGTGAVGGAGGNGGKAGKGGKGGAGADAFGGAIYSAGTVDLDDCTFTSNDAYAGNGGLRRRSGLRRLRGERWPGWLRVDRRDRGSRAVARAPPSREANLARLGRAGSPKVVRFTALGR